MNRVFAIAVILASTGAGSATAADVPRPAGEPVKPATVAPAWSFSLSAGGGLAPDYEGSNYYIAAPAFAGRIGYGNRYLALDGFDLKANVIDSSMINFGPVVSLQLGRKDVKDSVVKKFADIADSVAVGAFASYTLAGVVTPLDSVSMTLQGTSDVSGVSDGFVGTASVGYALPVTQSVFFSVNATASAVSKDYAQTYFGVSSADSLASGLSKYTLGGGVKDVGLATTLTYAFNESWSVTAVTSVKQLLGDFAKSPIVDKRGSATQFASFVTINRSF